jgi:hypothetical protein
MAKIPLLMLKIPEAFLQVEGDWIVDFRSNSFFLQISEKRITLLDPQHELIIDVIMLGTKFTVYRQW